MNTFFLIFIALPAIEIFLMIKIGGHIGALSTLGLIFLTAIIGIYYARIQGIQTLRSGIIDIYRNKAPIQQLITGATIAFAAVLLIVPGFFTDLIGFILLIPISRSILFKIFFKNKKNGNDLNRTDSIDGEIIEKDKDEL